MNSSSVNHNNFSYETTASDYAKPIVEILELKTAPIRLEQ